VLLISNPDKNQLIFTATKNPAVATGFEVRVCPRGLVIEVRYSCLSDDDYSAALGDFGKLETTSPIFVINKESLSQLPFSIHSLPAFSADKSRVINLAFTKHRTKAH
jgi:hypothetical protein